MVIVATGNMAAWGQGKRCAWIEGKKPIMDLGPGNQGALKGLANLNAGNTAENDTLYTLPVVVHIIHSGTAVGALDNPGDSLVRSMIEGLNKAWRKNGPFYGGADMKIQFALAKRSPSGNTSSGINRVNGSSVPGYVSGGITNYNAPGSAPEEAIKRLSRWPNTDYINIWIVKKINGSDVFPGGYAYFPEYNSAITDGLVLLAGVVNGDNKTIVHEMGHYFFLYHTFYDEDDETNCPANNICVTEGDRICDTEPCLVKYDCNDGINPCSNNTYLEADALPDYSVLNNYMGYTDCQWMFTQDQKVRARDALLEYRYGLISSGAFKAPSDIAPAAACIPASAHGLSRYYGVQRFDFNTLHVYSNTSKADSSIYFDRTANQSTTIVKEQTYAITVTGSYLNPHRVKVFIDYNNNGSFGDAGETVLSGYDGIVSGFVTIPATQFLTHVPLRIRVVADNPALPAPAACNINGTMIEGAGQAEDYSLIVIPRQIQSVNSGAWNAAATWSCNCIPGNDDEILIKTSHAITLSNTQAQCGKLTMQPGSSFTGSANLKLTGKN